jgi:hypothetical protein
VFLLGVSKFGSVRFGFYPKKTAKPKKKERPETEPEPAGSGPVSFRFFIQKTGQTYRLILGFLIGFLMGFVMSF